MSKSLGTGIDPMDLIFRYGADATRFGLIWQAMGNQDIHWDETALAGGKKFANKLWNITRYILGMENSGELNKKLKDEFDMLAKDVTLDMDNFRFYMAAEKLYAYTWHRLADEIIEESKENKNKKEYGATLHYILENSLKLLQPFIPFVTEEIWSMLPNTKNLLIVEQWPKYK